jgi:hypothetical protein
MIKALSSLSAPNPDQEELSISTEHDPLDEDSVDPSIPVMTKDSDDSIDMHQDVASVDTSVGAVGGFGRPSWRGFRWGAPKKKKGRETRREVEHETAESESAEWKGDEIAWICISKLVDEIKRLSTEINAAESSKSNSISILTNDSNEKKNVTSRLEDILSAAPPSVMLRMHREQLAAAVFDQIRTIGLRGLHPLLDTVRILMLGDYAYGLEVVERQRKKERDENNSKNESAEIELDKSDAKLVIEVDSKQPVAIGIESDPDHSTLWKSLLASIGYSRGFDYLRKNQCVTWFLELQHDARAVRKKLKLESAQRKSKDEEKRGDDVAKDGKDAQQVVDGDVKEKKGIPVGHPLRAKL